MLGIVAMQCWQSEERLNASGRSKNPCEHVPGGRTPATKCLWTANNNGHTPTGWPSLLTNGRTDGRTGMLLYTERGRSTVNAHPHYKHAICRPTKTVEPDAAAAPPRLANFKDNDIAGKKEGTIALIIVRCHCSL